MVNEIYAKKPDKFEDVYITIVVTVLTVFVIVDLFVLSTVRHQRKHLLFEIAMTRQQQVTVIPADIPWETPQYDASGVFVY